MDVQTAHRKEIFRQYNRARHACEVGRANRALGLLMNVEKFKAKIKEYDTTYYGCSCPDTEIRNMLCKHRIAFVINWRAIQHVAELIEEGKVEFEDDVLAY
ncbi:MAG: hypothetical protein ACXABD_20795 [Candidatus Thorarchaeota archaeon]|jgi:hypothetical protein